jgi:hypothetical protein
MHAHRKTFCSRLLHAMAACLLVAGILPTFIQPASGSPAATITLHVDTNVDNPALTACVDITDEDCSLRGAITHANGDIANSYIIAIPDGIYLLDYNSGNPTEDANASGDLDIIHPDITLQGSSWNDTILDGNHTDRVIDQLGYMYHLSTYLLTIRNGQLEDGDGGGAGIRIAAYNIVDLDYSNIHDNIVHGTSANYAFGGGIYSNTGAELNLEGSTIQHNHSDQRGGGIWTRSNQLTINSSNIMDNYAAAPDGIGGGLSITNGGTTIIDHTIFVNNESGRGGGLFNSGGASMTITNSYFHDNISNSSGGGLELYGSSMITNVDLYNNTATAGGGGIAVRDSGSLILTNATLVENSSTGNNGGGIYVFGSGTLSLNHVTLSANTAYFPGNALYAAADSSVSTVSTIFDSAESGDTCAIATSGWSSSFYNLSSDSSCNLIPGLDQVNKDPLFGTFFVHGGFTYSKALLRGSPAIDKGKPGDPSDRLDQRGVPIQDGDLNGSWLSDIGAYEYIPPTFLPLINK